MKALIFKKNGSIGISLQTDTVIQAVIRAIASLLIHGIIIVGLVLYEYFIGRSWIVELTCCLILLTLVFGRIPWKKHNLTKDEIKDFIDKM